MEGSLPEGGDAAGKPAEGWAGQREAEPSGEELPRPRGTSGAAEKRCLLWLWVSEGS